MGKGSRNSQKRAQDKIVNSEMHLEKQKNQAKKTRMDKVVAAVCIVFAVLIAVVLVLNVIAENGVFIRMTSAIETQDVRVDAAMMSFFLNDYIMNWMNTYSIYVQYGLISLKPNANYHYQYLTSTDASYLGSEYAGYSWYDYFLSASQKEVEMYIVYAQAAKMANITLTNEDYDEINSIIDNIKSSLKSSGVGFSDWYGRGVNEGDVRKCYELIYLASNFSEFKQDEFESALEKDDAPVFTYRDENKEQFYFAEVLSYKISISSKNFDSDKAFDEKIAKVKEAAEKIATAKTPEEFVSFVDEYESMEAETATETETEKKTEKTTGTTAETETLSPEEELESKIEDLKDVIYYGTEDELDDWLFDESETLVEGDVTIIEETGTETEKATEKTTEKTTVAKKSATTETEGTESESESTTEKEDTSKKVYDTYTVTVYYVVKPNGLDTSLTKDAAYLITDDKAAMEAFIESLNGEEALSRDKFKELADKAYEKLHEGHDHSSESADEPVFAYDSQEKMTDKYFITDYDKLNEYLDAGNLKDKTLSEIMEIKVKEKVDGKETEVSYYAVIYFEKYNVEAWYASAFAGKVSENFEKWYEDNKKAFNLQYNNSALNDITTIMFN